jgi:hypothetical protein
MGVRIATVTTTTVIASPAGAAETLICTTGPINLIADGAQVLLTWYLIVQLGAGVTSEATRLRRGPLVNSPLVNVFASVAATASTTILSTGCYADSPGLGAEIQYTLTLTLAGASAPSSVLDVCLTAMVL